MTKLQYVADDCEQACGRQGSSLAVACDVTKEEQVKSMASSAMVSAALIYMHCLNKSVEIATGTVQKDA
eukprot:scaffold113213_cov18-Tisochrysis_lutea.AAC.1